jgi:hypothetical protein
MKPGCDKLVKPSSITYQTDTQSVIASRHGVVQRRSHHAHISGTAVTNGCRHEKASARRTQAALSPNGNFYARQVSVQRADQRLLPLFANHRCSQQTTVQ